MERSRKILYRTISGLSPEEEKEIVDIATVRTYVGFGEYRKLNDFLSQKTPEGAKQLVNARDSFDLGTPVHTAVYKNDVRMLRLLKKYGADMNIKTELSGLTPLMIAIKSESFESLKYLLSIGVDKMIKNEKGQTAEQMLSEIMQDNKDMISTSRRIISTYKDKLKAQEKWLKILSQHTKE